MFGIIQAVFLKKYIDKKITMDYNKIVKTLTIKNAVKAAKKFFSTLCYFFNIV